MYDNIWPSMMKTINQNLNRSMSLRERLELTYIEHWSHSINSCQGKFKVYANIAVISFASQAKFLHIVNKRTHSSGRN